MAHVYIRSAAAGTGTGATWTNAYTTLAAALSAKAAGDNFWVSEDHAETQASGMTLACPGTATNPCTIICVNHAGTVPPVSADLRTTATITTTGNNGISMSGSSYVYGITLSSGSGANGPNFNIGTSANGFMYLKNCVLNNGTSGFSIVQIPDACHMTLDNTQITFASTSTLYSPGGVLVWKNTVSPFGTANIPTTVVWLLRTRSWLCNGLDFSNAAYGSITLLNNDTSASTGPVTVQNCKTASGMVLFAEPSGDAGHDPYYSINSDSTSTNYLASKVAWNGTETIETTIVRTGGASDGTTAESAKIVTNANAKWITPFEAMLLPQWNDTTATNRTVTVYGIWGGGAVPNNDDIWIEVSYLGSSSAPLATINTSNTKADYLATAAGQTSDASTWGGSTTAFKMAVTLSSPQPGLKGPIYVTVKAGKPSSTFYVDRKPVLS